MSPSFAVSHIGIVVSDLDRATRFYCEGLGFTRGMDSHSADEIRELSEFSEPVELHSRFIKKDGLSVELLLYASPKPWPSPGRRALQQLGGPTHIALRVDNLDAGLERVRRFGGTVLEHTRTRWALFPDEDIEICYCVDPDDVRISLSMLGPQGLAVVG